jgi:hypothetical protein
MKALLYKLLTGSLLIIHCSIITGQTDKTDFNLQRRIELKEESEIIDIKLPVAEEDNTLNILIRAMVSKGGLIIEIYDPAGKKQGNFSIVSQLHSSGSTERKSSAVKSSGSSSSTSYGTSSSSSSGSSSSSSGSASTSISTSYESVVGQISKSVEKPSKGDWNVKIIPKDVTGHIEIGTNITQGR